MGVVRDGPVLVDEAVVDSVVEVVVDGLVPVDGVMDQTVAGPQASVAPHHTSQQQALRHACTTPD